MAVVEAAAPVAVEPAAAAAPAEAAPDRSDEIFKAIGDASGTANKALKSTTDLEEKLKQMTQALQSQQEQIFAALKAQQEADQSRKQMQVMHAGLPSVLLRLENHIRSIMQTAISNSDSWQTEYSNCSSTYTELTIAAVHTPWAVSSLAITFGLRQH